MRLKAALPFNAKKKKKRLKTNVILCVCVGGGRGGYGQALRSVTKRYMGVGGSLKYQQKSVTYFMDGPAP